MYGKVRIVFFFGKEVMRVPQQTSIEHLGNVSWQTWRGLLQEVNSPLLDEGTLPYYAAQPYTALCLADLKIASRFGTLATEIERTKNPFLLRNEGSFSGLMEFESWEEAVIYWKRHALPSTETHTVETLWEIVRLAESYTTADQARTFSISISNYLDDDGVPLSDTYVRWFGEADGGHYPLTFHVWLEWCKQRGVYPTCTSTYRLSDNGTELTFSNGLRIYDNGETAYVVGDVQY
jgi:hypothetical protein